MRTVRLVEIAAPVYRQGRLRVSSCPSCGSPPPALQILPARNVFRCTRCGLSGGPVQYLMASKRIGALDAASALGLIPEVDGRRNSLLKTAARWYASRLDLPEAEPARRFLDGRGIHRETRLRFGLGYAPPSSGTLVRHLLRRGFTVEEMASAGLLRPSRGSYVEVLRGRLVFPITDPAGRVVGFAGRSLDGSEPKYMNTFFRKSETLYGLPQAAHALRSAGEAILVEGYTDVLTCTQNGIRNVLSLMGTSLGDRHAAILRRYVDRAVVLLDADASPAAAEKAARTLARFGISARTVLLPDGDDPDALVRAKGPEALLRIIDEQAGELPGEHETPDALAHARP